jgi:hypothetical protein
VVGALLAVLAGEKVPHPLQGRKMKGVSPGGLQRPLNMPSQSSFATTCQVTPELFGSLLTVAVNDCVPPEGTVADSGETETFIDTRAVGTVIATEADFVVSATAVAVRLTVKVTPGGPGAVYVVGTPLAVAVGETEPHVAPLQVMLQVTPLPDGSLLTIAVNCVAACGGTVKAACDSETLMTGGGGGGGTTDPPPHPQLPMARAAANNIAR